MERVVLAALALTLCVVAVIVAVTTYLEGNE